MPKDEEGMSAFKSDFVAGEEHVRAPPKGQTLVDFCSDVAGKQLGSGLPPQGSPGATAGCPCAFGQQKMGTSSESRPPALVGTLCDESYVSMLKVSHIHSPRLRGKGQSRYLGGDC